MTSWHSYLSQSLDVVRLEVFRWVARVDVRPVTELIVFDAFFLFRDLESLELFSVELTVSDSLSHTVHHRVDRSGLIVQLSAKRENCQTPTSAII